MASLLTPEAQQHGERKLSSLRDWGITRQLLGYAQSQLFIAQAVAMSRYLKISYLWSICQTAIIPDGSGNPLNKMHLRFYECKMPILWR